MGLDNNKVFRIVMVKLEKWWQQKYNPLFSSWTTTAWNSMFHVKKEQIEGDDDADVEMM